MKNALSFDIEEYFHAEAFSRVFCPDEWPSLTGRALDTTRRLLDLLDAAGVRATFFILGWFAERHGALVREIGRRGHEVASHGYGHRMIHRQTRQEFQDDIARAKAALEQTSGSLVIGYRAPTFSVVRETLWSLGVLCEAGFRYDSSIFPIVHDRYGIPDAPRFPHRINSGNGGEIAEFPLSTFTLLGHRLPVAGGGYFRLFPYEVSRRAIEHLNRREGQPAIVYLHPWDLDPGQPRLPVGWFTWWRHSVNTDKAEAKLQRLLNDFEFAPVSEVLALNGVLTA